MNSFKKKLLFSMLVVVFLVPGGYVAFKQQAEPARAQLVVGEVFSVTNAVQWIGEAFVTAIEHTAYQMLKFYLNNLAHQIAYEGFKDFASLDKGQAPLFFQKSVAQQDKEVTLNAIGFALEGMVIGAEQAQERVDGVGGNDIYNKYNLANRSDAFDKRKGDFAKKRDELNKKFDALMITKCGPEPQGDTIDRSRDACVEKTTTTDDATSLTGEIDTLNKNIAEIDIALPKIKQVEQSQIVRYKEKQKDTSSNGASDRARAIIASLCNPSLTVKFGFLMGFARIPELPKPLCDVKQAWTNWQNVAQSTGLTGIVSGNLNGWKVLKDMTDPGKSDVGKFFEIYTNVLQEQNEQRQLAQFQRSLEYPSKDIKNLTGSILTPGPFVATQLSANVQTLVGKQVNPAFTGKLSADIGNLAGSFLDTLVGKSWEFLKKGIADRAEEQNLASQFDSSESSESSVYDFESSPISLGQRGAAERTARLASLEYTTKLEDIDALFKFTVSDQKLCKQDPYFCVLGTEFAQAIRNKMTVIEALKNCKSGSCNAGLYPDGKFGFNSRGAELEDFSKDYPYSSLVILRKFRVIPVSWEIAALYIQQNPSACGSGGCTLGYVVSQFTVEDSPFYRMIDPNWVLKIPPAKCYATGYGPMLREDSGLPKGAPPNQKTDNNGDGRLCTNLTCLTQAEKDAHCDNNKDFLASADEVKNCDSARVADLLDAEESIPIRPQICLDERTCLSEDGTGKGCANDRYGYCLEEQKKFVFGPQQCNKEFESCQRYRDGDKDLYFLENSLPSARACSAEVAGCAWLSAKRLFLGDQTTGSLTREWSDNGNDKVYLSTKASVMKCPPEAEGCRLLTRDDGSNVRLRIAPEYYQCDQPFTSDSGATLPGYRKKACNNFAFSCSEKYAGCSLYRPANGDSELGGIGPLACDAQCVGIQSFAEQTTGVEQRFLQTRKVGITNAFVPFVSAGARSCPAQEVGCEEFTDLDKERTGTGESKVYFSKLAACKKKPAISDAQATFYSWFGSDAQGGSRLVKYELVYVDSFIEGPDPLCAPNISNCTCNYPADPSPVGTQDPIKGTCREFLNVQGKSVFKWSDLLITYTDEKDCHPVRRSLSGEELTGISTRMSASCSAENRGCHEYRSPAAGNTQVIFRDDFDNKSSLGWQASINVPTGSASYTITSADPSNEAVTFNASSLHALKVHTLERLVQTSLVKGATYHLTLAVKGASATNMKATLRSTTFTGVIEDAHGPNGLAITDEWQYVALTFPKITSDPGTGSAILSLAFTQNDLAPADIWLDAVTLKSAEGIEYKIKNSIPSAESCKNTAADVIVKQGQYQYGCQSYVGSQPGNIQGFDRVCPAEMVGCSRMTGDDLRTAVRTPPWSGGSNISAGLTADGSTVLVGAKGSFDARLTSLKIKGGANVRYTFRTTIDSSAALTTIQPRLIIQSGVGGTPLYDQPLGAEQRVEADQKKELVFSGLLQNVPPSALGKIQLNFVAEKPGQYIGRLNISDTRLDEGLGYFVDSPDKRCTSAHEGCTAYGLPTLDERGNVRVEKSGLQERQRWSPVFYALTPQYIATHPDDAGKGICKEEYLGCKQVRSGTSQINIRNAGARVCYLRNDAKDDAGKTSPAWKRKICEGTLDPNTPNNPNIGEPCTCPLGQNECDKAPECAAIPGASGKCIETLCPEPKTTVQPTELFWVRSCPAKENTCRKIVDPECSENILSSTPCDRNSDCASGATPGACVSAKKKTTFAVQYFKNTDLSGAVFEPGTATRIDHNWRDGAPVGGFPADYFSVRWEGKIRPPVAGRYTFRIKADDGVRLWVSGEQLLNEVPDHGHASTDHARTMSRSLAAGEEVDFKLEFYEMTGWADVHAFWSADGMPETFVSPSESGSDTKYCALSQLAYRTDFGRKTPGVSCVRDYYYRTLDTQSMEGSCAGNVDVEAGCLLFNDKAKDTYEYEMTPEYSGRGEVNSGPDIFSRPPDGVPRCEGDKNILIHDAVPWQGYKRHSFQAFARDPQQCYDEYWVGPARRIAVYTKRKTSDLYDSAAVYIKYWDTNTKAVSVDNTGSAKDANTILKVSLDRQCKVWLECKDYLTTKGGPQVCFRRAPCDAASAGGNCENYLSNPGGAHTVPQLAQIFESPEKQKKDRPNGALNLAFASLTGLSRPNFIFSDGTTIQGGHDGYFDWAQERHSAASATEASSPYKAAGYLALKIPGGEEIFNSCRIYPKQDSPEFRMTNAQRTSSNRLAIDACFYSDYKNPPITTAEYRGIYGYCLEPNPKFYSSLYGSLKGYRTAASQVASGSVQNFDIESSMYGPWPNGYPNMCLNWLPIDHTDAQPPVVGGGELAVNGGTVSLDPRYYCLKTESFSDERVALQCKDVDIDLETGSAKDQCVLHRVFSADLTVRNNVIDAGTERTKNNFIATLVTGPQQFFGNSKNKIWYKDSTHDYTNVPAHPREFQQNNTNLLFVYGDSDNSLARLVTWVFGNGHSSSIANDDYYDSVLANAHEAGILFNTVDKIEYSLVKSSRSILYTQPDISCPKQFQSEPSNPLLQTIQKSQDDSFTYILRDAESRCKFSDAGITAVPIGKVEAFQPLSVSGKWSVCDGSYNRSFLAVRPRWSVGSDNDKSLVGWEWRMCDKDWSTGVEFGIISIKIHIKENYQTNFFKQKIKSGEYCSEYVLLAQGINYVQAKEEVPAPEHFFDSAQAAKDPDTGRILGTLTVFDRTTYSNDKFNTPQSYDVDTQSQSVSINDPFEYNINDGTNQIDRLTYATQNYYARPYEYWKWMSGSYQNVSDQEPYKTMLADAWKVKQATGSNPVVNNMAIKARTEDVVCKNGGTNCPDVKDQALKFSYTKPTNMSLTFQIDIPARQQLPIRYLAIDWGDGVKIPIFSSDIDGEGISNKTGGALKTFDVSHDYSGINPKGLSVCVLVMDNWEKKTKQCGVIQIDPQSNKASFSGNFTRSDQF